LAILPDFFSAWGAAFFAFEACAATRVGMQSQAASDDAATTHLAH
jgi:hypothetical protein